MPNVAECIWVWNGLTKFRDLKGVEGPFTACLKDVRPSTTMTFGWQFTGSAFTLPVNALQGQPTPMYQKVNFKLLLFHWRKYASITKTFGDAFLEWCTRCGEAPHGSVREFLEFFYFHPLESNNSVKIVVPSADVNGPWVWENNRLKFQTAGKWPVILEESTETLIGSSQCSRLKSSMPFKHVLGLQNIPLSKEPFKTQPQITKWRRHLKPSI